MRARIVDVITALENVIILETLVIVVYTLLNGSPEADRRQHIGDMLLRDGIVVNPGLLGDPAAVDLIENPVPRPQRLHPLQHIFYGIGTAAEIDSGTWQCTHVADYPMNRTLHSLDQPRHPSPCFSHPAI